MFLRQSFIQPIGQDLLGEGDGARRFGGQEVRFFQRHFQGFARGRHVIHQADTLRFRCGNHFMEKQNAPRAAHANPRGQEMRQAHIGHQANLVETSSEARIFRSDDGIAGTGHRHAGTRCPAFHGGNNRLAALGHETHELMRAAHTLPPRDGAINIHGGNIAASAESTLGPRYHNGTNGRITMGPFHYVFHRGAQHRRDSILA